jgi:hypothetical protein
LGVYGVFRKRFACNQGLSQLQKKRTTFVRIGFDVYFFCADNPRDARKARFRHDCHACICSDVRGGFFSQNSAFDVAKSQTEFSRN